MHRFVLIAGALGLLGIAAIAAAGVRIAFFSGDGPALQTTDRTLGAAADAGRFRTTARTPGVVRVEEAAGGISFEVPAGWVQDPNDLVWRPAPGDPRRLGVVSVATAPGFEPRSLLPGHAEVASEQRVDLGWALGTTYTLQVAPPAAGAGTSSVEKHVVVMLGSKRAFDFFIAAPSGADSGPLSAALDHLLGSVILHGSGSLPEAAPAAPDDGTGAPRVRTAIRSRGRVSPAVNA